MVVDGLLLVAIALGHIGLTVLLVNVVHGYGIQKRRLDLFMAAMVIAFLGVGGTLAWAAAGGGWSTWPVPIRAYGGVCLVMGLVLLPATTLALRLRRLPFGVRGQLAERDLRNELGVEELVGTGPRALMLRLPGNASFRLEVREYEVEVAGLPRACDGLRIAQWSDLHFTRGYRRRFFEEVADELARREADLVVFTGDLIDERATLDWIEPVFSRVRGRLGSFAILGNHDYEHAPGAVAAELEAAGYTVVEGCWGRVECGGAAIVVGGTSAPWGPPLDPGAMPEGELRLVLSHSPDLFYGLARWGVDLVLSGHNHGGQVRLPVVGPVLMPSRYSRRFDRGFFRRGRSLLYVNQGVAGKWPLRYGCPPELTRFVLRPARPQRRGRALSPIARFVETSS